MRMNKSDLVTRIMQDAEVTKRQAEKVLEAFMESIQTALSGGESLSLVGFGRFSVLARAARKGRNPRTGQDIMIPTRKSAKFSAGKVLRQGVQSPPQGSGSSL
jgi:DNA-binding protein HU-beta